MFIKTFLSTTLTNAFIFHFQRNDATKRKESIFMNEGANEREWDRGGKKYTWGRTKLCW